MSVVLKDIDSDDDDVEYNHNDCEDEYDEDQDDGNDDTTKPPVPGDEFALHGDGIYCKEDHELVERCEDNNNKAGIPRIKSEMDDFRDNLSDLGRDDDLRWENTKYRT